VKDFPTPLVNIFFLSRQKTLCVDINVVLFTPSTSPPGFRPVLPIFSGGPGKRIPANPDPFSIQVSGFYLNFSLSTSPPHFLFRIIKSAVSCFDWHFRFSRSLFFFCWRQYPRGARPDPGKPPPYQVWALRSFSCYVISVIRPPFCWSGVVFPT